MRKLIILFLFFFAVGCITIKPPTYEKPDEPKDEKPDEKPDEPILPEFPQNLLDDPIDSGGGQGGEVAGANKRVDQLPYLTELGDTVDLLTIHGVTGEKIWKRFYVSTLHKHSLGYFQFDTSQQLSAGLDNYVLTYDHAAGEISLEVSGGAGSGEANTASNIGTAGVGVFDAKVGSDLQFRNINAASSKISVTDDVANDEIDIDVNEANLTITESQISDLGSYLTSEVNDLSSVVTWANVPNANITQASVTQHESALTITESQISDLGSYLTSEVNDLSSVVTWANVPNANITQASVTQHESALTITESQISDLGSYLTSEANDLSSVVTWANVPNANITQASVTQHESAIDHDALTNFVANEHIDWTGASSAFSTTGTLTSGGATATLGNFVLNADQTVGAGQDDYVLTYDNTSGEISLEVSAGGAEVNDLSSVVTWANVPNANITQASVTQHESAIDHDALTNFVANEHIDHSSVSITAGVGLSGGGTIAATRDLSVDLNELTTETSIVAADRIAMIDDTDNGSGQISLANFESALTITESQISDLGSYLTSEVNDLSSVVTWANVPNANITQASVTQHESAIDHDALTNFVANEHIDWTGASSAFSTTGTLTSGGATATLGNFVLNADQTVGAGQDDYVLTYDNGTGEISLEAAGAGSGEANTASNIGTAGVGVFDAKVGSDLQFRNINAASSKISVTEDVANDEIDIDVNEANLTITESQISDLGSYLTSEANDLSSVVTWANVPNANITQASVTQHESAIDHDALTNFVANEHIDHSSVSITAGVGLSGGGTIAATRDLSVDLNELTTETSIVAADRIAMIDDTDNGSGQISLANFESALTITESQISDLGSYLTSEVNDLSSVVTWANVPNANITQASVTQHESAIDHDALTNFVANEHIDWTGASSAFSTTGTLTSGGATATLGNFVLNADQTVGAGQDDYVLTYDNTSGEISLEVSAGGAEVNDLTSAVTWANVPNANITQASVTQHESAIDHDALTNFVANEHIDWTGASSAFSTTGTLTSGGATATLGNFVLNADQTVGAGQDDYVLTYDNTSGEISLEVSAGGAEVNDLSSVVTWANVPNANITQASVTQHESAIDHDALTNFVANEHIDHSSVSITAGVGLSGGGTIAATRDLAVDLNELPEELSVSDVDHVVVVDATDGGTDKMPLSVFQAIIDHDALTNFVANEHIDWTGASSAFSTTGTLTSGGATATLGNFVLNADQTVGAGQDDYVLTYDNTSGEISLEVSAGGAEVNDLTSAVTWANVPNANITQASVTQHESAIDHDALTNFVANEHIDHSSVSITAGVGLSGGGTIAATRDLALDFSELSDVTVIDTDDEFIIWDATTGAEEKITDGDVIEWLQDSWNTAFLGNVGIDVVYDDGFNTYTWDIDLNEVTTETSIVAADRIVMIDDTDNGTGQITLANFESAIDHDALTNFVANEHIDWTGASSAFSTTGTLTSGGATATLGNFVLNADQTVGAGQDDYVLTYDNGTGEISLEAAGAGSGEANTASNIGTAGVGVFDGKVAVDLQFRNINTGSSGAITITDDSANDEIDVDLNIDGLSDGTAIHATEDELAISDNGTEKRYTIQELFGGSPTSQSTNTFDWGSKMQHTVIMDMTSFTSGTFTFSNPIAGGYYGIQFKNVSGTDTPTWPSGTGGVYQHDGTAFGSATITESQIIIFFYDGTNYYATLPN